MLTKILYFVQNKSFTIIYLLICWQNKFGKKFLIHTCGVLVPNCPGAKLSGAKLSYHRIQTLPFVRYSSTCLAKSIQSSKVS